MMHRDRFRVSAFVLVSISCQCPSGVVGVSHRVGLRKRSSTSIEIMAPLTCHYARCHALGVGILQTFHFGKRAPGLEGAGSSRRSGACTYVLILQSSVEA